MNTRIETEFPYLSFTNTVTPHSEVDETNYNKAVLSNIEFPKRLRVVKEFQESIKSREVLERIVKRKNRIVDRSSFTAYRPITRPYPFPVVYDYEVLPVFTELSVPITRSVFNLTTGEISGQTMQIGVRVEIPVEFQPERKIQVIAGILNIPGAQISNTFLRKHRLDEELMTDLSQRHFVYLRGLISSFEQTPR